MDSENRRVLDFLVGHFRPLGAEHLITPFFVPGVTPENVLVALRDLHQDGLIEGVPVNEVDYPVRVTGVTAAGRRAVAG